MSKDNDGGNFLVGLFTGALLAGGSVFFFGTKKGKEMQKELRTKFPDAAKKIDEVVKNIKDNVEEVKDTAEEKLDDVSEKVNDLAEAPRRFFKRNSDK